MVLLSNDEWLSAIDESPHLSKKSKQTYKAHVRTLLHTCGVDGPMGVSTILFDLPRFLPRLVRLKPNAMRSHLILILSLFKRGEERQVFRRSDAHVTNHHRGWMERLFECNKAHQSKVEDNLPTDREVEAAATLAEWATAKDYIQQRRPDSQEALLVAFHALAMPPLRGGDLSHVRVGFHPTGNCIYVDEDDRDHDFPEGYGELIIREHKTSSSFPELRRELPPELVLLSLRSIEKEPRDWLFSAKSGGAFSDSGFSTWKTRVFRDAFKGKPVTTNSLRHAYISGLDRQNQSIRQAREIADAMGHSLGTQRQYVRL
jgi:hypothetical protein